MKSIARNVRAKSPFRRRKRADELIADVRVSESQYSASLCEVETICSLEEKESPTATRRGRGRTLTPFRGRKPDSEASGGDMRFLDASLSEGETIHSIEPEPSPTRRRRSLSPFRRRKRADELIADARKSGEKYAASLQKKKECRQQDESRSKKKESHREGPRRSMSPLKWRKPQRDMLKIVEVSYRGSSQRMAMDQNDVELVLPRSDPYRYLPSSQKRKEECREDNTLSTASTDLQTKSSHDDSPKEVAREEKRKTFSFGLSSRHKDNQSGGRSKTPSRLRSRSKKLTEKRLSKVQSSKEEEKKSNGGSVPTAVQPMSQQPVSPMRSPYFRGLRSRSPLKPKEFSFEPSVVAAQMLEETLQTLYKEGDASNNFAMCSDEVHRSRTKPLSIEVAGRTHVSELSTPRLGRERSLGEASVMEIRQALSRIEKELDRSGKQASRALVMKTLLQVADSLESPHDRDAVKEQLSSWQEDKEEEESDPPKTDRTTQAYRKRLNRAKEQRRKIKASESRRKRESSSSEEDDPTSETDDVSFSSFSKWVDELEENQDEVKSSNGIFDLVSDLFYGDSDLDQEWAAFNQVCSQDETDEEPIEDEWPSKSEKTKRPERSSRGSSKRSPKSKSDKTESPRRSSRGSPKRTPQNKSKKNESPQRSSRGSPRRIPKSVKDSPTRNERQELSFTESETGLSSRDSDLIPPPANIERKSSWFDRFQEDQQAMRTPTRQKTKMKPPKYSPEYKPAVEAFYTPRPSTPNAEDNVSLGSITSSHFNVMSRAASFRKQRSKDDSELILFQTIVHENQKTPPRGIEEPMERTESKSVARKDPPQKWGQSVRRQSKSLSQPPRQSRNRDARVVREAILTSRGQTETVFHA